MRLFTFLAILGMGTCIVGAPALAGVSQQDRDLIQKAVHALQTPSPSTLSRITVVSEDDAVSKKLDEVKIAYLNHLEKNYDLRYSEYQHQAIATEVILVLVLALSGFGVYLSYRQFQAAYKASQAGISSSRVLADAVEAHHAVATTAASQTAAQASAQSDFNSLHSSLQATWKGITISSGVLGTTILVLSFAFFFVYVRYVYVIVEPGSVTANVPTIGASAAMPEAR